jgi:hypothetical protein
MCRKIQYFFNLNANAMLNKYTGYTLEKTAPCAEFNSWSVDTRIFPPIRILPSQKKHHRKYAAVVYSPSQWQQIIRAF